MGLRVFRGGHQIRLLLRLGLLRLEQGFQGGVRLGDGRRGLRRGHLRVFRGLWGLQPALVLVVHRASRIKKMRRLPRVGRLRLLEQLVQVRRIRMVRRRRQEAGMLAIRRVGVAWVMGAIQRRRLVIVSAPRRAGQGPCRKLELHHRILGRPRDRRVWAGASRTSRGQEHRQGRQRLQRKTYL